MGEFRGVCIKGTLVTQPWMCRPGCSIRPLHAGVPVSPLEPTASPSKSSTVKPGTSALMDMLREERGEPYKPGEPRLPRGLKAGAEDVGRDLALSCFL